MAAHLTRVLPAKFRRRPIAGRGIFRVIWLRLRTFGVSEFLEALAAKHICSSLMASTKTMSNAQSYAPVSDVLQDAGIDVPRLGAFPTFGRLLVEFDLRDAEEVSELFTHRFAPIRVFPDNTGGEAGIIGSYAALRGVDLSSARFKGTFTMVPVQRYDGVCFFLPSNGSLAVDLGGRQLIGSPVKALSFDAATYQSMTFRDGLVMPAVVIARPLIAERLSLLLGRPIIERPVFHSEVDLDLPALGALKSLIALATGQDFSSLLTTGALTATRLNEMILDAILENWPNNYSSILRKPSSSVAPRYVKLVLEHIAANPGQTANGSELAALSGVSLRTLQAAFLRFTGQSVATYQREARLDAAYKELMSNPDKPIEDVALKWGFTNAGRFSRYFRDAYGVSPLAATRRKSRP
ncbi:UNVERIFIED_ORG: helix-turn-helix domain-containing protein (plasmid) [Roseateles sp. XES5]|nr:AraC family transcriptional regulator [Roseateles sp. XES5]